MIRPKKKMLAFFFLQIVEVLFRIMSEARADVEPGRPSADEPSNDSKSSRTAGEQVFQLLYKDVCVERDSLSTTNAMYAKMLEECATQNRFAEAAAASAKQEAAEARQQAESSRAERDNAIMELQRVTAEAAAQVAFIQSSGSAIVAKLTENLAASEAARASASKESAEALQQLKSANDQLRVISVKHSSTAAFQDRIITLRQNEVRQVDQTAIAAALAEKAQLATAADLEISRLQEDLVSAGRDRSELLKRVTQLEGALLDLQTKLAEGAATVAAGQAAAQAAHGQLLLQVQQLSAERDAAVAERDAIAAEADSARELLSADFQKALASSNAAQNEAQNKLLDSLNALTFMHNNEMGRLTSELQAASNNLALAQDRSSTLARQLRDAHRQNLGASKSKNEALKEQHAQMTLLLDGARRQAAEAHTALQHMQQLGAQAAAAFLAKFDEVQNISIHATHFGGTDGSQQELVSLRTKFAVLESRLVASEAQLLHKDITASEEVQLLRNKVAELQEELQTVSREVFRAEMDKAKSEFAAALHQAAFVSAAQSASNLETVRKLQDTMALNAQEVAAAATYKEQLLAASKQLEQLHGKAAKEGQPSSSPVGHKRRR